MLDNCDDVFIQFNSYATFAVTVVAESFLSSNNPNMMHSNPMNDWLNCKFAGKKFKKDCQIQPNIKSIHEYLSLLLSIPRLQSLFYVLYRQDSIAFILSLQMAFNTFI